MFKKIGFKLSFAVSVATILIIGIYAYINIHSQTDVLLDEVERHSNQLSETVISSTRYEMLLNNRSHISETIRTIGRQAFIQEVRILNKEGITIYSSDSTAIGHTVDKKADACYACHTANEPLESLPIKERTRIYTLPEDSTRLLGIINPIYSERSCWEAACHVHDAEQKVLGVLDIIVSLETIDQQIARAKFKMFLFALTCILALSGVLWYFVRRWVDKPVSDLVEATQHVAAGDLSYTIQRSGSDELGMLARSFNNMTQKLSEARMQLFQSDKMASLGRLAAGVAHEINNPLTGILTYSSYLMKRSKQNPEMQRDLAVIVKETKRSRDIVKGLLDFARQSIPKKHAADVSEIIHHVVDVVKNQLNISRIKLVKDLGEHLPEVVVDENQIQQVLTNLIVNAADAIGKESGTITISASLSESAAHGASRAGGNNGPAESDFVIIKVSDTGSGIAEANLSKIFDPFYTTKGHGGTGLGLAVVRGIIENHNGTISVESKVGKGTTFTVRLPLAPAAKKTAAS